MLHTIYVAPGGNKEDMLYGDVINEFTLNRGELCIYCLSILRALVE